METLLARYRNLTVLLVVVLAQLVALAYQVKTQTDERLIRVWAVTAVTPMAGIVEAIRHNTIGFLQDYFILLDVREQNRKLKADNDQLRMQNIALRNQVATAEHARALTIFQAQTPSKTVAARVIGNSTVATAKAVFIDRGSTSGVEKGMAVVTPEGIVGKVVAVYPLVAQVLLVTDPTFKVGVESQRGHVHGNLNCGSGKCVVEQIQNEEKVDPGEWFYTSGVDRVFPKGFAAGTVISAQAGQTMKDVKLNLSGNPDGAEEVLVILQGVHQPIPQAPPSADESAVSTLPPPPSEKGNAAHPLQVQTEADRILQKYSDIGKEQGHVFGAMGSAIPNFNQKPAAPGTTTPAAPQAAAPQAAREPTKQPTTLPPVLRQPSTAEPPLPLGAPKRKPAPPPEIGGPSAPAPPPSAPQQ